MAVRRLPPVPVAVRGGDAAPGDVIGGRAPSLPEPGGKVRVPPCPPRRQALVLSILLHLGAGLGGLMAWRNPVPGPIAAPSVVQVTWIASASGGPATPTPAGAVLAPPVLEDAPPTLAVAGSDPAPSAPAETPTPQTPAAPPDTVVPAPPDPSPGRVAQPAPVENRPDVQLPQTPPGPSPAPVPPTAVIDPTDPPVVPHPDPDLPARARPDPNLVPPPPDPAPTDDIDLAALDPAAQAPDAPINPQASLAPAAAPSPPRRAAPVAVDRSRDIAVQAARPRPTPAPKAPTAPMAKAATAPAPKAPTAPTAKAATTPAPKAPTAPMAKAATTPAPTTPGGKAPRAVTAPQAADTAGAATQTQARAATDPGAVPGPVANASPARTGAADTGAAAPGGPATVVPGASLKDLGAEVRAAIDQRKRYPERAGANGLRGTVRLEVRIDAQGRLIGARIVASSGAILLDHAALAAAEAVPRYPAARAEHGPGPFTFVLPIAFRPG